MERKKLIDLIRETRRRRTGAATEEVVVICYFSKEFLPHTLPKRARGTELKQVPGEPFESFKARAVAAARASGDCFVVICVSESGEPARSVQINDAALQKKTAELTDAELLVLASGRGVLHEMTDADLAALANGGTGPLCLKIQEF